MRPGVDDLFEFMVRECGVDTLPTSTDAILADRSDWRTIQARTIARDMQSEVADVLQEYGWGVTPPEAPVDPPAKKFLTSW